MAIRRLAFAVLLLLVGVLAGPPPVGSIEVVAGSTWFSDGTKVKAGPVGTTVRVYAVGAIPGVPYKLVLAVDDDGIGGQCTTTVQELNPNVVYAGPSGLIGRVTGTVRATTPMGTYIVCFKTLRPCSRPTPGAPPSRSCSEARPPPLPACGRGPPPDRAGDPGAGPPRPDQPAGRDWPARRVQPVARRHRRVRDRPVAGFEPSMVTVVIGCLAVGAALLAPAIVSGRG